MFRMVTSTQEMIIKFLPGEDIDSLLTLNHYVNHIIETSPELNLRYLQWLMNQIPRYGKKRTDEAQRSINTLNLHLMESKKSCHCNVKCNDDCINKGKDSAICCTVMGATYTSMTCLSQCTACCCCCNATPAYCFSGVSCCGKAFGPSCLWGTCYPTANACLTGYGCIGAGILAFTFSTLFRKLNLDYTCRYSFTSCCIKRKISQQTALLQAGIKEELDILEERLLLKISMFSKRHKQQVKSSSVIEEKAGKTEKNIVNEHDRLLPRKK